MPSGSTAARPAIGQAPGDLATVQAFVNTLDIEMATDDLASLAGLSGWLEQAGLTSGSAGPARQEDLELALRLREALRGVLRSHARHGPAGRADRDAVARLGDREAPDTDAPDRDAADGRPGDPETALSEIAASMPIRLHAGPDGRVRPVPAGAGVDAALTRLLLISAEASTAGTWARLKACSADDCQWAFYDRSPTKNACWCSMQICGSRAKSRAYRRRAANPLAARDVM